MRSGWPKRDNKPKIANLGESCTDGKGDMFLRVKEAMGQAFAEDKVPQTPCGSNLKCDCVETKGTHELGTWKTRTCKCVEAWKILMKQNQKNKLKKPEWKP